MNSESISHTAIELPILPDSWRWCSLRDLVDPERGICYGIVQPGKHDPDGIPMVNTGDVFDGYVARNVLFRVSKKLHEKFSRSSLRGGELLVTLVGANFGRIAIAPDHYRGSNCSRAVGVVPIKKDAEYVMFALRSPLVRHLMDTWANTTAQPTFNLKDLGNLPIPIPPECVKTEITCLLKSLDERITLLRETNTLLEQIAQTIFKSWFVDLDPVRAKMEGRQPEGIDEETAALFPDGFEESELGMVPRGWKVMPLGDAVETVGGGTPDTKNADYWSPEEHSWTSPKDLSGLQAPVLLKTERKISTKGLAKVSPGLLPQGTLLMSSRAPIGYMAITNTPVAINQGYIAMPPGSILSPPYMLFWCRQNMEDIKNRANGSTFMEISKKAFRPIPVLVPDQRVLKEFGTIVDSTIQRIINNEEQAQILADLRDTLLPRLISGKLRLPEAAEMIEGATA